MSYLILPGDVLARIYDQPLALNRSHSGLSRLVAGWYARDGDRPFDMVRLLTGGKSGSFPMNRSATHEMGFAHRTPFGGVETTDLPEWARSNNPTYSLLAISLNTGSTASSQVAITQQGAGWAGAQIYEGNGSSNVIRGGTTRDTTSAGSTGIAVPIGRRYCAVVVDQSTTIQCAVNGQLDTAGSPAGSYNATQSRLASGDTARPVYLMLCWRRALSQGEQIEYSARPDQLFMREPEVSYFLFQAAGGGGGGGTTYNDSIAFSVAGGLAATAQQEAAARAAFSVSGGFASSTVAKMSAGITLPVTSGFAAASRATHNLLSSLGSITSGYAASADVTTAGEVRAAFAITGGLATGATQVHSVVAAFSATFGYSVAPTGKYSVSTAYSLTPGFASSATGGTASIWTPVTAASSTWTPVSSTSTTWSS